MDRSGYVSRDATLTRRSPMQDGRSTASNITHMLIPKVEMIMMQVPQRVTMVIRTRTEASQRNGYGMIKEYRKQRSLSQRPGVCQRASIYRRLMRSRRWGRLLLLDCVSALLKHREGVKSHCNSTVRSKLFKNELKARIASCVQRIPARHVIKSVWACTLVITSVYY